MELLQRFDQEIIDREPDRTAPVGVAAEQATIGLGRLIAHGELVAIAREDVRVILVTLGERPYAVWREKLGFIQHAPQQTLHSVSTEQREQHPIADTWHVPARDQRRQIGPVLQKPNQAAAEVR